MRTREESLNNFCRAVDALIDSKYLFANKGIHEIITVINSSKLLSDLFKYFTEGFNFYDTYVKCVKDVNGEKSFELPTKNTEVIAFVYSLLLEINYAKFQLADFLEYMSLGRNYEANYKTFCQNLLIPFKSYTYQIGMQVINSVKLVGENDFNVDNAEQIVASNEQIIVQAVEPIQQDVVEQAVEAPTNKPNSQTQTVINQAVVKPKVEFQRTLFRLLELDKLAITQSHVSKEDKEELIYVLSNLNRYLLEGDAEKIALSYMVYYYALKPYKKIKTNIKDITEILVNKKIL